MSTFNEKTEKLIAKKAVKIVLSLLPLFFLIIFALYLNLSGNNSIHIPCPLFELTGFACPGCGATRGVCAILTFRIKDAFKFNAAVFLLFFFLTGVYVFNLYKLIRYNKLIRINVKIVIAIGVFLIIFVIIRNMPFYPYKLAEMSK